jgi:hypothetical protein
MGNKIEAGGGAGKVFGFQKMPEIVIACPWLWI